MAAWICMDRRVIASVRESKLAVLIRTQRSLAIWLIIDMKMMKFNGRPARKKNNDQPENPSLMSQAIVATDLFSNTIGPWRQPGDIFGCLLAPCVK
jgi:hypothetical protein